MKIDFLKESFLGRFQKKQEKHYLLWLGFLLICILGVCIFSYHFLRGNIAKNEDLAYGMTFSKKYAEDLGLDWRETYSKMLEDFDLEYLRIGAYWDQIEKEEGVFTFEELDWMLDEADKKEIKVILGIGRKLPRWPECHEPAWTHGLGEEKIQEKTKLLLNVLVTRYKSHPAIWVWQVENEPLFVFGDCPFPDYSFLKEEVALVKSLDDTHQIMMTDSGELSTWVRIANLTDILGISMYRLSFNRLWGYVHYPLAPRFYSDHAELMKPLVSRVLVSELQAEPWFSKPIFETSFSEQYRSMNPDLLRDNIDFVKKVGLDPVLLWGVEWWYWAETKGHGEMLETAKELLN